jgi:NFU1 iron-sulfur cluster scaffold homolog, mitochondrial
MEPSWDMLTKEQKLAIIRSTVEAEIAPFLAADGGGLRIIDLVDSTVKISYQGSCACCPMALSGTLSFVQHVISTKVHPSLTVTPVRPTEESCTQSS